MGHRTNQGLSSLAPGASKMRDPGNEVVPVPPSLDLLFNIFNCTFCPVQVQMVIFHFKEEGTGTEHVAIATSKCVPSDIFLRVQTSLPSFNSIVSLLVEIFLILCHTTTTDDIISG